MVMNDEDIYDWLDELPIKKLLPFALNFSYCQKKFGKGKRSVVAYDFARQILNEKLEVKRRTEEEIKLKQKIIELPIKQQKEPKISHKQKIEIKREKIEKIKPKFERLEPIKVSKITFKTKGKEILVEREKGRIKKWIAK